MSLLCCMRCDSCSVTLMLLGSLTLRSWPPTYLKWTVGASMLSFSFPYQFTVSFYRQLFCTFFSFLKSPTSHSTLLSADFVFYFTENKKTLKQIIPPTGSIWVTHTPYHVSQLTFWLHPSALPFFHLWINRLCSSTCPLVPHPSRLLKNITPWDAWVAQSVRRLTSAHSGHDLAVCEFEPRVGLCVDSSETGASFGFCVSLSLWPSPACALSLSVSQKWINVKKNFFKYYSSNYHSLLHPPFFSPYWMILTLYLITPTHGHYAAKL